MGLFNNKDSKRAADDRAYNDSNQPGQGISNNDSDRVNNPNNNNSVNDDRAYADNNTNRSNFSQNNPPDQRSGAMNLGGHQYQDPYSDRAGQHGAPAGHHGFGTNNTNTGSDVHSNDVTNTQNVAGQEGYGTPGQQGYSTTGVQAGAGQNFNHPGAQGGQNFNHPGAGTAAGLGATGAAAGYAAGGHTGTNNAAGNPDYYNPTEAQLQTNSGQVPTKGNILKQEYMGKLENAAGVLLSSESMKARGAQKEMEALAMKRQANELGNAQRLEQGAMNSRNRAVAHGAHPHHAGLGAAGQPGVGTVGAGPMQQPGGTMGGAPGNNVGGGMGGRY